MLRVGLTGGLGSGKSTAAHLFAELGVYVIQADEVGRALMQPGQPVYIEVIRRFGAPVVNPDGTLDRKALADLAFRQGLLRELNEIVHPPVIAAQEEWMEKVFATDERAIAMVESALIFEASGEASGEAGGGSGRTGSVPGWRERFDRIVLIAVPDEEKIARYVRRISSEPAFGPQPSNAELTEAATVRLAAQIPDSNKAALCDYVIDNSGSLPDLRRAVMDVYSKLKAESDSGTRESN